MRLPVLFALLVTLTKCHSAILPVTSSVIEGQKVKFVFPYPCDNARVSLQGEDGTPFYDSTKEEPISLSSERLHRFSIEDIKNGNCSLHLTISPVKSIDAGTYISLTTKHDDAGYIIGIIGLYVDTLPGKVSCTLNEYEVENWLELQCVAPAGSLPGEIQCYQNGERMPPLTEHIETTEHLRGTILVKNTNPVFCCTAAWRVPKDICECKDFYLRFDDTLPVTGEDAAFIDPCVTMTTSSAVALTNKEEIETTTFTQKALEPDLYITGPGPGSNNASDGNGEREGDGVCHCRRDIILAVVCTFIGVIVILAVIWAIRRGRKKRRRDRLGDRSGVKMESQPYVNNGYAGHNENDVDGEPPA